MVQLDAKGFGGVKGAGGGDQALGEVGVDAPVPELVGMGERVAGHRAAEAHMVELGVGDPQAGLDIPQALPVSELGEGHAEELVPAGEAA